MLELLKRQVLEMEDRMLHASAQRPERIAVFDLDGTLLHGDIGDAVFAYLILQGHPVGLSWPDYQRLIRTHRSKAYRAIVEAMAGMEVETVLQATSTVMSLGMDYLMLRSDRVSIPKPRPLLSQFVSLLREFQYQVFVISASNHISVQHVAQTWFDIPPSHAFGIQARIEAGRLTPRLLEPVPIGAGKAELYRRVAGANIPLITATDSRIDVPLLKLTHPEGLSLWVGEDHLDFDVVMENARNGQRVCFVGSEEVSREDEY